MGRNSTTNKNRNSNDSNKRKHNLRDLKRLLQKYKNRDDNDSQSKLMKKAKDILKKCYKQQDQEQQLQDYTGHCLLHSACSNINKNRVLIDLIRLLLEYDIGKTLIFEKDDEGHLPLHIVVKYSNIDNDDDDESRAAHQIEVLQLLLKYDTGRKTIFEKTDFFGFTPLHLACRCVNPSVDVIKLLLEHDVTKKLILEKCIQHNRLALHWACNYISSAKVVKVIKVLLEHDDLEHKSVLQRMNPDGYTKLTHCYLPLHEACFRRDIPLEAIQLLLDHDKTGTSVLEKSIPSYCDHRCEGKSPLLVAFLYNGQTEILRLLLRYYAMQKLKHFDCDAYQRRIDDCINSTRGGENYFFALRKFDKLIQHCKLLERTSLLELATKKANCYHGILVIMERVLEYELDDFNDT